MHWTALLAYRRFPADARVIDDLPCVECGYNLRGVGARGRCPECGLEIGNSLFVLAKPHDVARGIRTAGFSYFAVLVLGVGCLWPTLWLLFLATIFVLAGAAFRMWAVNDLRRLGRINKLPVIGDRLRLWWLAAMFDLAASSAWVGGIILVSQTQPASGPLIVRALAGAWLIAILASGATAGRFGHAMAEMLGHGWAAIELRVQQIALSVCVALIVPLLLVQLLAPASRNLWFMTAGCFSLAVIVTFVLTAIALMHVGNAAEHADETWDEVIGYDASAPTAPPPRAAPKQEEPPPIRLER